MVNRAYLRATWRWLLYTPGGRLFLVMVWTVFIIFYRLGELKFDKDEALIMVWATEVHDSAPGWVDLGQRIVREQGYYKSNVYPGLNIYLMAVTFRLLGVSPWTARLPSAMIALIAIPVFYIVTQRLFRNSTVSLVAVSILATSAPVLFLMRQCRYTSLTVLAGLWLIWAYLDIMERRRYGMMHGAGAAVVFIYTSFYLFLPLALSLGIHSLICGRGPVRRQLVLFIAAGVALTLLVIPAQQFSIELLTEQFVRLATTNQIAVFDKMSVCLNELNLFGIPLILIPIYLYVCRREERPGAVVWMAVGLFAAYAILMSAFGAAILQGGFGRALDWLWPALSPRVFNRLVDYRSWVLLIGMFGTILTFYHLRTSPMRFQLSLPVAVMLGMIALYCIFPVYRMPWTRYLVNPLVASYMLTGFLVAGLMARNRYLAIGLLALHVSTNILSILPFAPGHYPSWQWKLPHWLYRLATGDPIPETILNFVRIPPL